MREIKFRAWDDQKKIMTGTPFAITNNCEQPWMLVRDYANDGWKGVPTSRFIPMQYTGFKDKKCNEIWEGDIVGYGKHKAPHRVEWNSVKGKFEWSGFNFSPSQCALLQVIGNIYENPSLINSDTAI